MDYFKEAFGDYSPHSDPYFAAKFATNILFMDGRFTELASLLTDGHEIGGIEGEPGWLLERRDTLAPADEPYFSAWPNGAVFRAFVDPDSFELGRPEVYLRRDEFCELLRQLTKAVAVKDPGKAAAASEVGAALFTHPTMLDSARKQD